MYQGKVRIRVCGVLIEKEAVLLLKHDGLGVGGFIWSFPGGGLEFDEDMHECLKREFMEETGLIITVGQFLFINEYKADGLHAVELFFEVTRNGGSLKLGSDPEMDNQILSEIGFFTSDELSQIDDSNKHNIFSEIDRLDHMTKLSGYYKFDQLRK